MSKMRNDGTRKKMLKQSKQI
ncbi:MAG: hypothetical protein QOD29_1264, partial [Alphaproteobacteria bacterium]|nr:hypothetical protein [Alphaproteobacteria bacterium]